MLCNITVEEAQGDSVTFSCSLLDKSSSTKCETHPPFWDDSWAGHQEWGWISATQPLLFMILINWCQMSWERLVQVEKTFVSANNRPELVWIGKANRHFLSYLKEYLSLGSVFMERCELNAHHLLFVPSKIFPVCLCYLPKCVCSANSVRGNPLFECFI